MRFREDRPEDLIRARREVAQWRATNPEGTPSQLVADLGPGFHADYAPVLRSVLFMVDKQRVRQVTGIISQPGNAGGQP